MDAPRILRLVDFIDFAAGITGVAPREILNVIKEMALKRKREAAVRTGYKLVLEEGELRLVAGDGRVLAVYRRG